MSLGFYYQEAPTRRQARAHLGEQVRGVGLLVHHPERQSEVCKTIQAESILRTGSKIDSICQPPLFGAALGPVCHLLLDVESDYPSLWPDEFGHREAGIPEATPNIDNRLTGFDQPH
jgi:hypothetical protein